jgi:hypothetical protein
MESLHFYLALFFHLVFLILGFGSVMVIDTFGLLMLFKKTTLLMVQKVANVTQKLIWLGWVGMVISGFNLIILKGYIDNLTKIKIFLVLLIGLNGILLHKIKKNLHTQTEILTVPPSLKFNIFFSTLISQIGWWGALIIGFLHRHIAHNIPYPPNPYLWMINLLLGLLLIFALGKFLFKK